MVLLTDAVKNYRPVSLLERKQSLLVLRSNRKARQGWLQQGWPEPRWLEAWWPKGVARGLPCGKRAMRPSEEAKRVGPLF